MKPLEVYQDLKSSITIAIAAGLSDDQRYPTLQNTGRYEQEIRIEGAPELSSSLRDSSYNAIYETLLKARAFNLKMIDGALVQMMYCFKKREITSHRLAYFPCPDLHSYDLNPTIYEDDELFGDVVSEQHVRFPLRFDFSASLSEFIDVEHPMSHLTLGHYKNCRIPVNGPLTPTRFMMFLIRNFYYPANSRTVFPEAARRQQFPETISRLERDIAHLVV
jgi:hypothetical protein